jgi:starch synthase
MSLRVCQVASELAPLAKTGGLGDVVAALSAHLARRGHDVRVFVPLYSRMDLAALPVHPVSFLQDLPLTLGPHRYRFSVRTTRIPGTEHFGLYLLDCPALYHRAGLYDQAGDEHLRFAVLSRAALECCQRMGWAPQVLHAHDWHTALLPLYLRTVYGWDQLFAATRTVLTLHNLGYQGVFPAAVAGELDLVPHAALLHQDDLAAGRFSFLKTGLLYAGALTTVSPTYAREIQTPEHGFGLDDLLRRRSDRLVGILNGVDYAVWSPEVDPHLPHRYSAGDLIGKARCKRALQERLELPVEPRVPLLGVVSRLVHQKGLHLAFEPLAEALAAGRAQLIVQGRGEERLEQGFRRLERRFPDRARYVPAYDDGLAHQIEAGADVFLMPSLYEPCGLNQMYSLRYGTPPVVRKTGGLADTVEPWDPARGQGTGFVFEHADVQGFRWGLGQALDTYDQPAAWLRLMKNGMARDFSWDRQGERYEELYTALAG